MNGTWPLSKIITTALFFFITHCGFSQNNSLGTWNIVNLKYTINEKWSFFSEAQIRSLNFYSQFHYHEYKAGVNYKAHPNVLLTLAAGDYDTYKEGGNFVLPKNNEEFRIWAEVALTENLRKLKIDHRYRAEFRFTSNGFRNRFRYRIGAWYPFGKQIKGLQISV